MRRLLVAAVLAATVAAMPLAVGSGEAAKRPVALLPDPAQSPPKLIQVQAVPGGGWGIGFLSAVLNAGRGPLTIHGHRDSTAQPTMVADQVVARSDGTTAPVAVGTMQYVATPTHNHWHLLDFERYELRRASDAKLVGLSQKRGFCLTDTANDSADKPLPGERDEPVYRENCGLNEPDRLEVTEGISVGWMDVYDPFREGQFVDVTDAPSGRYLVVNRVNFAGRIRELRRSNDASSVLVKLSRPDGKAGKPVVEKLASCFYSIRCYDRAPRLALRAARRYARRAAVKTVGRKSGAARAHVRCHRRAPRRATCSVRWRKRKVRWAGKVKVASVLDGGAAAFSYHARIGKRKRCAFFCDTVRYERRGFERV